MFRRQHVVLCLQERSPELDGQLRSLVSAILRDTSSLALFAETGLPSDRGLVIEFLDRFWRRVLPAPREDTDLSKLLIRLFTHNEVERFALMPADIFGRVVKAYSDRGDSLWRPMVESLWEAFRLLAVRIQALGVSEKLRVRSSRGGVARVPFLPAGPRVRNARAVLSRRRGHRPTGEGVAAGSRDEYRHMWRAAAGGGLVTAGTAAIKLVVAHAGLPLFVEGFLASVNYAVSFILIQSCHFVLATKQPSMTAATFAGIIRNTRGESRMEELSNYVAQIFRSQLAAAFGNILAVARLPRWSSKRSGDSPAADRTCR